MSDKARRAVRSGFLCAAAAFMGVVSMISLNIALSSDDPGQTATLIEWVMPAVFLFGFYRLVGNAFASITGHQAPWSYEAIFKGQKPPQG